MLLALFIMLSVQFEVLLLLPNQEPLELPLMDGNHEELLLEGIQELLELLIEGNHDELLEGSQLDERE